MPHGCASVHMRGKPFVQTIYFRSFRRGNLRLPKRIRGHGNARRDGKSPKERKRMNEKYSTDARDVPAGAPLGERPQEPYSPLNDTSHHAAARSLVQMFSLYPLL